MINICFHGIGSPQRELETNEAGYWISKRLYLQIIDEIAGRDDIFVSFDDGNSSDIEIALQPLLNSGRLATFFVLAGRLDQPGSLAARDLLLLRDRGMEIGSHGMDHIPWRRLSREQMERELTEARSRIADAIDHPVTQAALPLGRYDRRTLGALRSRGYQRVFSSDRRRARATGWLQPRYSVHADDTIDSVRANILQKPPILDNVVSNLKGVAKRLR